MMSTDVQTLIPQQQARSRWRLGLAWFLILALVGLVAYGNARSSRSRNDEQLLMAEQARMFGMLALQMKSLQMNSAGSDLVEKRMDLLIGQLEATSQTPQGKLRLAILAGENIGPEAALKRLAEVEVGDSNDVVSDLATLRTIYTDGPGALEPTHSERLIQRYGFLGQLALAYGVPADQEPRKTLLAQSFSFTVRAALAGLGVLGIVVLSLALFVTGCVWFFRGKIHRAYIPQTYSLQAFLEAFAIYLVLFALSGRLLRFFGAGSVQWTWATLLILPIVWKWIALRTSTHEFRQAVGWHRGKGVFLEFGVGLAGYFACLPVIMIGAVFTFVLIRLTGAQAASPIIQELNGSPWTIIGVYGLGCVFAPVMEETMFRGIFLHHLRQRWTWIISAPIVSVIFAILHPQGWVAVPVLSATAIVLAALREWRGSLIAPIAAHACNNFLALTLALLLLK